MYYKHYINCKNQPADKMFFNRFFEGSKSQGRFREGETGSDFESDCW